MEIALETPDVERTEQIWRGRDKGSRLTLYYLVRSVRVPGFLDDSAPRVETSRAAEPRQIAAAAKGGPV